MASRIRKINFDAAVIGGGFYGISIALFLQKKASKVIIVEKEADLLTKASYNNQARVHNGYHYPRSFITALRSHVNYPRFISDFRKSIIDQISMIYAIASGSSKTTSRQFVKFCEQIDSPITEASPVIKRLFNETLIEDVFKVEEAIFNATVLRKILKEKLKKANIKVFYNTEILKVGKARQGSVSLYTKKRKIINK